MYLKLSLFLSVLPCLVIAQEHQTFRPQCVYYVPTNTRGATPDGHAACSACDEIRRAKHDEQARKIREELAAKQAKITKANADRLASIAAEKADIERRNAKARAELNDIQRQNDNYDNMMTQHAAKAKVVKDKYNELTEKANREYSEYLNQLQLAAAKRTEPNDDAFWNETMAPANYVAYQDNDRRLWGFVDRQGNTKIAPQYERAKNFSNGISFVQLPRNEQGQYPQRIIDAKGGLVKELTKEGIQKFSAETGQEITGWNFPDTISEGVIVMKFDTSLDGRRAERYGALDKHGNLIVPPIYYKIGPFVNGLAKASKLIKDEDYKFEHYFKYYRASFYFLEIGLIDKTGHWVDTPQKKMEYSHGWSDIPTLTIEDRNAPVLTEAEKKARKAREELYRKQQHTRGMERLEEEVLRRVAVAQGQGYLIEEIK